MLISFAGKGGVGKTTVLTLLLDEVARRNYTGRVLVIDADPALSLAMALKLEPGPATSLAEIRTKTPLTPGQVHHLPAGVSPVQQVLHGLQNKDCLIQARRHGLVFHFLAMGYPNQPGCYCRLNRALTTLLKTIRSAYDLILVDNEPGLEHLSRFRLNPIDLLVLVMTGGRSSWAVGNRLRYLTADLGLKVGEIWEVYNRMLKTGRRFVAPTPQTILLPESDTLGALDRQGGSPVSLVEGHLLRLALAPIVDRICGPAERTPVADAGLATLEREVSDLWDERSE